MMIRDYKRSICPVTNLFFLVLATYILAFLSGYAFAPRPKCVISPIILPIATPSPTPVVLRWRGEASYYSEQGCLGCSKTLTMANGERLDDTRRTIAMTPETVRQHHLLNTTVTITNNATGATTTARVTDTGGFARYSRIADLSLATKVALGCADLCTVEIVAD